MGADVYRRGVAGVGHRESGGGAGQMRERNKRAREYSYRCRMVRLARALWAISILLMAAAVAFAIWLTAKERQAAEATEPRAPAVVVLEPVSAEEPENLLVCTVTGYCACCTPYSHMNQRDGLVLTASGQWVAIGEAVAVDPEIIPLGSKVTLGGKTYIAADTGVKGYVVDVLMSHEEAQEAVAVRALVEWEAA